MILLPTLLSVAAIAGSARVIAGAFATMPPPRVRREPRRVVAFGVAPFAAAA